MSAHVTFSLPNGVKIELHQVGDGSRPAAVSVIAYDSKGRQCDDEFWDWDSDIGTLFAEDLATFLERAGSYDPHS